jgi:hypothetical protein
MLPPEAGLLNKGARFTEALGLTKLTNPTAMI